jgi:GxxExxY protein
MNNLHLNYLSKEILDASITVHKAQVISYLRLTGKKLGFLINFNVPLLKDGFNRLVYKF